jgi:hypothetical protein
MTDQSNRWRRGEVLLNCRRRQLMPLQLNPSRDVERLNGRYRPHAESAHQARKSLTAPL